MGADMAVSPVRRLAVVGVLAAASLPAAVAAGLDPAGAAGLTDLGTLGGPSSLAVAVNDRGQVAGTADTAAGPAHAFRWTPAGGMADLGTLGGPGSSAVAIDADGRVAGTADTATGAQHAFLWSPGYGLRDLGTLGGGSSAAAGLNDRHWVVGTSTTAAGDTHAFLWRPGTGMRDLGTLGGATSTVTGLSSTFAELVGATVVGHPVNATGQVVGSSATSTGAVHAFRWTRSAGMQDLGTFGGPASDAVAVDDAGAVTGRAETTAHSDCGWGAHAFRWTPAGGMADLGLPPNVSPTGIGGCPARSAGWAVEPGTVVGAGYAPADEWLTGFRWSPGAGMQAAPGVPGYAAPVPIALDAAGDLAGFLGSCPQLLHCQRGLFWSAGTGGVALGTLDDSFGSHSSALAVSAQGGVVGWADGDGGNDPRHAVLWTP